LASVMGLPEQPARNAIAVCSRLIFISIAFHARATSALNGEAHQQLEMRADGMVLEAAGEFRPHEPYRSSRVKAPAHRRPGAWHVAPTMSFEEQGSWRSLLLGGRAALNITMWSAKGLAANNVVFDADPYCNCSVVGKPESVFSTPVATGTETPQWDSSFLLTDFQEGDNLLFKVLDSNSVESDGHLGKAIVRSDLFWPMGYEGTVRLEDTGSLTEPAYIEIKISSCMLPDLPEPENATSNATEVAEEAAVDKAATEGAAAQREVDEKTAAEGEAQAAVAQKAADEKAADEKAAAEKAAAAAAGTTAASEGSAAGEKTADEKAADEKAAAEKAAAEKKAEADTAASEGAAADKEAEEKAAGEKAAADKAAEEKKSAEEKAAADKAAADGSELQEQQEGEHLMRKHIW